MLHENAKRHKCKRLKPPPPPEGGTRQSGSHIRLTTTENGEHHLTIPDHSPIKIGTLSAILTDIAAHFNRSKDDLVAEMFR